MTIRPYDAEKDFAALRQWISDARTHALWCAGRTPYPLTQPAFDAFLQEEAERCGNLAFTAENDGGRQAGFFCLSPIADANEYMLKFVIVDSSLRGQGYGREMLRLAAEYVFSQTDADALRLMVFSVNTGARKCYLKAGFTECEETPDAFRFGEESWGRCSMRLKRSI